MSFCDINHHQRSQISDLCQIKHYVANVPQPYFRDDFWVVLTEQGEGIFVILNCYSCIFRNRKNTQ